MYSRDSRAMNPGIVLRNVVLTPRYVRITKVDAARTHLINIITEYRKEVSIRQARRNQKGREERQKKLFDQKKKRNLLKKK